jgi:WD40 repeat protein
VYTWDVDTRRELVNWAGHADEVWAAAYCAEGRCLVTGSRDGAVKAWNSKGLQSLRWELNEGYPIRTITSSPDGSKLLAGGGVSFAQGAARLLTYAGKPIGEPLEQAGAVWAAAWAVAHERGARKRTYATSNGYNRVRLWDLESGLSCDLPPLHHSRVTALAFHPADSRILLTGSTDGTARLWNTTTGEPLGEPLEHPGAVNAVAFAAHGSIVVTGDAEGNVRFWDASTVTSIGPPMRHQGAVWATESHPDGRSVFSARRQDRPPMGDPHAVGRRRETDHA